ncbi:hypothetical protein LAZ67_7002292 [Cordylochernes scorpioides]|uniref:Helitron helicase-like domain-containing protein n=1 Tax=Cordylochernes scorpioides TaxID=51811 RepID=A0ABY6KN26_9ARAC|nr:hypothetical protein LAZ67_7002292 [Cordylochernes scorpioides]
MLNAWLPELPEAKVAAHWRIPKSLKPASKVTGCATEFNAHQRIPNSLKPVSKVTGCATEFNAHQRILNSLKPVSKVTGCATEFNAHQRLPSSPKHDRRLTSCGKVRITDLPEPPEALRTLLDGSSPHSAEFMQRVVRMTNVTIEELLQFDAWLPELLEAKVAAHWRIPNSLKPASKVTGCATEFNAHQRIPNSLKPVSKMTGCATEFNAHQRILNSLKPVSKVTGCATEFNAHQTPQQSQTRQEADQLRYFRQRASTWADMLNAAFHYNPALNYEQFTFLQIGHMDKQCLHCTAFKYNGERPGMCCSAGKVKIPDLPEPPEALRTLLDGSSPHSAEFMQRVLHYNNAFQMTSFRCGSRVVLPGYMPTFKVQGQVYHRICSVLPPLNSDSRQLQPAFLQVFFIGDSSAEVATRHRNFPITKPHIVSILQDMLHRHNPYVHLFKASIEKMPSPDYKLVIKADKAPPGHHPRTFNAPTINEVAIVIVQENCDRRDIVLSKRGSGVQRINEFHRSYDALQYPLVFWNGQDGYHFHIPQLIDGVPSAHKTVSCMDFYASLLMIRSRNPGITNWLLAFGDLTHQILVDIYAKVESERLHYISAIKLNFVQPNTSLC